MERRHTDAELAELRALSTSHVERGPPSEFTCDGCGARYTCEYVFDWYNTDGDCLAEK